jgi:hypothetical protein
VIDIGKLAEVKSASVAIGLADKTTLKPKVVIGSGFFASSTGLVITAGHVFEHCVRWQGILRRGREETEVMVFDISETGPKFIMAATKLENMKRVSITKPLEEHYVGPINMDIGVATIADRTKLPCLEIKTPFASRLYDEIALCGYPAGNQSFAVVKREVGIRLSPILQFGRISGFMPTDGNPAPYGIYTDIIGTAGSSGSPVIDDSGKIVAIAQQVLTAEVSGTDANKKPIAGLAKIGLINGISHQILYPIVKVAERTLRSGREIQVEVDMGAIGNVTFTDRRYGTTVRKKSFYD